ncbi:MAG TPA: helical backbone metal receptor, partial [Gemmatimonadaceae bacterium]|nr:helical backbone metal receptor [Gemmatimonadaceae bacterium]
MKRVAIVVAVIAATASLKARTTPGSSADLQVGRGVTVAPRRIISLVPATTEMLFAMGAGDRIAGVSDYDRFPPEVSKFPKVGGLIDPNVERVISLRPDLVIVYDTQTDLKQQLDRARIPVFRYVHRGLPDITETLRALGERVGSKAEAEAAAARMESQLAAVRARVAGRPRPTTLLVFGRDAGALRHIDASGGYGFLHDVLELAGGTDVLGDLKQQSVDVSTEMILRRAPEVIIELHY